MARARGSTPSRRSARGGRDRSTRARRRPRWTPSEQEPLELLPLDPARAPEPQHEAPDRARANPNTAAAWLTWPPAPGPSRRAAAGRTRGFAMPSMSSSGPGRRRRAIMPIVIATMANAAKNRRRRPGRRRLRKRIGRKMARMPIAGGTIPEQARPPGTTSGEPAAAEERVEPRADRPGDADARPNRPPSGGTSRSMTTAERETAVDAGGRPENVRDERANAPGPPMRSTSSGRGHGEREARQRHERRQTSWRRTRDGGELRGPGAAADRDAASMTRTERPAPAKVIAAARPFGPDPTRAASSDRRAATVGRQPPGASRGRTRSAPRGTAPWPGPTGTGSGPGGDRQAARRRTAHGPSFVPVRVATSKTPCGPTTISVSANRLSGNAPKSSV